MNEIELVKLLDSKAKNILLSGSSDEEFLISLSDVMGDIKRIMDSNTQHELDLLCEEYPGFYRYMKLLEQLASGIASGKVKVP